MCLNLNDYFKQVDIFIGQYTWTHSNHKSKTYNRHTKTKRKEPKHKTKENHQTTGKTLKEEKKRIMKQ